MWVGCSSDGAQAGDLFPGNVTVNFGGSQPRIAYGSQIGGSEGGTLTANSLQMPSADGEYNFSVSGDPSALLTFDPPASNHSFTLKWDSGNLRFDHGNLSARQMFVLTGDETAYTLGTSAPVPSVFCFPNGYALGSSSSGRRHNIGTAAPTTGNHARGEIVFNRDPSAGGNLGWICTSTGTPGTWKTFGTIAN
jgi:hypothetical protein